MPSILLLLLLGSVLFQSDERLGRTFSYCTDGTDFLIEHRDVYLQTEFSEARLKEYFSRYLKHPGEIYITASNDHDFIKRLWVTEGGPTLYDLDIREPLQTDKPLAYFYKIGRDAFFEYRDAQGADRLGYAPGRKPLSPFVFRSCSDPQRLQVCGIPGRQKLHEPTTRSVVCRWLAGRDDT